MAREHVHTIIEEDLRNIRPLGILDVQEVCPHCGQKYGHLIPIRDMMGRILPQDVGKRIYAVMNDAGDRTVYQVENNEQLARRLQGEL